MTDRFERAMKLLAVHEGGYVNHPDDPGGPTNMGVTKETYDAWRHARGLPAAPVGGISEDEVTAIYRAQYWDAVRADDLPPGVGYAVFDGAVNSGPAQAAKWLQRAVGAEADGVVGVQTLAATRAASPTETVERVCDQRLKFMRRLKHYSTFKNGWKRRVSEVREQALIWANAARDGVESQVLKGDRRKPAVPKDGQAQARGRRSLIGALVEIVEALLRAVTGGRNA